MKTSANPAAPGDRVSGGRESGAGVPEQSEQAGVASRAAASPAAHVHQNDSWPGHTCGEVRALEAELARVGLVNGLAWKERAEKAEAEIERLKAQLSEAKKALLDRDFNGTLIIERGGRESGERGADAPRPGSSGQHAAANPAAHSPRCWCMDHDPRELHERIRELEAELERLKALAVHLEDALKETPAYESDECHVGREDP